MNIKIESHYIPVYDNIREEILSYGDELNRTSPVRADHTRWQLQDENRIFDKFIDTFHEIYPKYKINELWGCTYQQGDFTQSHNQSGFDLAFAWFVDSCSHCSPLVFPNFERPWLPPLAVIKPLQGNLVVFSGKEIHYVSPHTCPHHRMVVSGNLGLINAVG